MKGMQGIETMLRSLLDAQEKLVHQVGELTQKVEGMEQQQGRMMQKVEGLGRNGESGAADSTEDEGAGRLCALHGLVKTALETRGVGAHPPRHARAGHHEPEQRHLGRVSEESWMG
jgi:hypothetical protein